MRQILTYLFLIAILGTFDSCKKNAPPRPDRPDNLIAVDHMVDIIYDMAVVSAAKNTNRKVLESNGVWPDTYVYTKHGIDSIQFARSNAYYAYDLELYESIYLRVKQRLERERITFEAAVEQQRQVSDSLRQQRQEQKRRSDTLGRLRKNLAIDSNSVIKLAAPLKSADTSAQSPRRQN